MKKYFLSVLALAGLCSGMQAADIQTETASETAAETTIESTAETAAGSETTTSVESKSTSNDTNLITWTIGSSAVGAANKPKLQISPSGRILADAAVYAPDGRGFTDGVALPDIRIGFKATYGNWMAKVDLGFGKFKFSPKDIFIQYKFNDANLLRAGYFVHQFGLQASTSSSFKCAMEAPTSDTYFQGTARNLGVMYVLDLPKFFMGMSAVFGNSDNLSGDKITRATVGVLGRYVWRPIAQEGKMVQVGISGWYQSPTYKAANADGKGQFNLSANFPTRVVGVGMLGADVTYAGNQFKLTPELLLSYDRFALESQYYYMNVNRHRGLPNYVAQGCYAWLRCLLFGETEYKYSHADAGIATPQNKTLELVLGYDYTNASHKQLRGGVSNDYSVTLNYHFNKYLLFRLGWRYVTARDSQKILEMQGRNHVNIIQARIQFKF